MSNQCLRCGVGPTINAHIIPKSAVRNIRHRGPDTKTIAVFGNRAITARNQNGVSDRHILCKDCDGKIGTADKWFIENMESFHAAALDQSSYSAVQIPLDPRAALRFAVSVVYRASLSSLDHFTDVSLGTYAKIAAEIAVNSDLSGIGMPLVAINVLTSETLDMKQLITYPVRCSGGNGQYYVFVVSGIQFLVKFGGMNDRIGLDDSYTPIFRVRPDAELTVCCYPFQDSAEFEFLADPTRQRCTH